MSSQREEVAGSGGQRPPWGEMWSEARPPRHFQSINLWRSVDLERCVEMAPLALLDMRTVEPAGG